MMLRWDKLSQKRIDLIVSLGYGALSIASHFAADENLISDNDCKNI
jgi:hypothetical protein